MRVTSEHEKERSKALERLAEHGWREAGSNRKGYIKVLCGCGEHMHWLPKTPSNRYTLRNKVIRLINECSTRGQHL